MKKQKTSTIYSKFFFSMTIVSTLFMVLLFVVTSIIFSRHFLGQESSAALKQLDYISSQFQFYLDSTQNYSKSIIIDNTVQNEMKKYEKNPVEFTPMDQLLIKSQINKIIQSIQFIHSVTLYSTDGMVLATTENYPYANTLSEVSINDNGIWISQRKHSQTARSVTIHVFSYIRPIYDYSSARALGYIEISLPESVFSIVYRDNTTDTNHIFITNENGVVQSSDGSLALDDTFPGFSHVNKQSDTQLALTPRAVLLVRHFAPLNWYMINEINLIDFITPTAFLLLTSLVITTIMIAACMLISRRLSKTITSPLYQLITHTQTIKQGTWIPIHARCNDMDIRQLFDAFNSMILAQEELKNTLLEAEKQKNQLSLDLLQEQINPHFLYNTLDNICALAELDEKKTLINIVMSLSTFYRESLSNGHFYVTIKEELEITKAYLYILQIRYYNKFDYSIQCPEELYHHHCLKLLLQPIVENSIYHGIKELEYKGFLKIIIEEKATFISITIRDNGVGIPDNTFHKIWEKNSGHFGIKNIHQRIQLYYGSEYGLTIHNLTAGGCETILRIGKKLSLPAELTP